MVVDMACLEYIALPVGVSGVVNLGLGEDGCPLAVVSEVAVGILVVVEQVFFLVEDVDQVHVLDAVEAVETVIVSFLYGVATFVCDGRLSFGSFLCGDQHDTVGRADTVDGGRGILENLYRLDVSGVKAGQRRTFHIVGQTGLAASGFERRVWHDDSVDNIYGVAATADGNIDVATGLSAADSGLETCRAAKQHA